MNVSRKYFFAVLMVIGISACTKAIIDEPQDLSELPPIQRTIKYNPDVQNIMFNSCVTCHGGAAPNAGLDLTTYTNVRFSAEMGSLVQRMNSVTNPMPPSGILSPQQRQIIDKWVADGYPQ